MNAKRIIRKATRLLTDPDYRFHVKDRLGLEKSVSDEEYLRHMYRYKTGKVLNLENPVTFNEKLQWLKLHDRKPEYVTMVDKYAVKEYVAERIGAEYVIPLLGVWDSAEDIDFQSLPDRFVLKCTHDSGGLVICKDKKKLDVEKARSTLRKSLQHDYFAYGREWPYKNVPHRVIAEQYMEDSDGKGELTDYKLHYFSGDCKAIMVGQNRFGPNGLENDYYTPEWEHFDFTRGHRHNAPEHSPKPPQMDKMIELGKKLALDMPFVRVDFYVINGKIYFGEITFYPASGFNLFHPDEWDRVFGDWIHLPKE